MGHSRPLFLYFHLFNTVDRKQCSIKTSPMTGFELRTSLPTALPTEPQPLPTCLTFTYITLLISIFLRIIIISIANSLSLSISKSSFRLMLKICCDLWQTVRCIANKLINFQIFKATKPSAIGHSNQRLMWRSLRDRRRTLSLSLSLSRSALFMSFLFPFYQFHFHFIRSSDFEITKLIFNRKTQASASCCQSSINRFQKDVQLTFDYSRRLNKYPALALAECLLCRDKELTFNLLSLWLVH